MGGRGTYAAGNNVNNTYIIVGEIADAKILQGLNGKHSLPEEAHTSTAYIKLYPDGRFCMLRIYGTDHYLLHEIAVHPEPSLDPSRKPILHIHEYDQNFTHGKPRKLTLEEYSRYKKYLKGVKWYD